jgi:hypothetical protein
MESRNNSCCSEWLWERRHPSKVHCLQWSVDKKTRGLRLAMFSRTFNDWSDDSKTGFVFKIACLIPDIISPSASEFTLLFLFHFSFIGYWWIGFRIYLSKSDRDWLLYIHVKMTKLSFFPSSLRVTHLPPPAYWPTGLLACLPIRAASRLPGCSTAIADCDRGYELLLSTISCWRPRPVTERSANRSRLSHFLCTGFVRLWMTWFCFSTSPHENFARAKILKQSLGKTSRQWKRTLRQAVVSYGTPLTDHQKWINRWFPGYASTRNCIYRCQWTSDFLRRIR